MHHFISQPLNSWRMAKTLALRTLVNAFFVQPATPFDVLYQNLVQTFVVGPSAKRHQQQIRGKD